MTRCPRRTKTFESTLLATTIAVFAIGRARSFQQRIPRRRTPPGWNDKLVSKLRSQVVISSFREGSSRIAAGRMFQHPEGSFLAGLVQSKRVPNLVAFLRQSGGRSDLASRKSFENKI